MAIKIITDSTCDLSYEQAELFDVEMVPLSVNFTDKSYLEGVDISREEFYEKLATAHTLPTTSQVNPAEFHTVFSNHIENGDCIVGVFLSSEISGTFQSAKIASEMFPENRIFLVDSRSATLGLGLLVKIACELRDNGKNPTEIQEAITALATKVKLLAVVNTLKYFKMGGRISSTTAFIGEVMGMSPMVALVDGSLSVAGKSRGKKSILTFFDNYIEQTPIDHKYSVAFAHSQCPELLNELVTHLSETNTLDNTLSGEIGAVIGTHAGPNCYGLAYIAKD